MDAICVDLFNEDHAEALADAAAAMWELKRGDPLEFTARVSPIKAPDEVFIARFTWAVYQDEAPSLKFIDPTTRRVDVAEAWPQCDGFRPTSFDACVPWTKEGQQLHPEWAHSAATRWPASGNSILHVMHTLQYTLDYHFHGRYKR